MRALFGCGLHPLAELRQQQLEGPDLTLKDFQNVVRLGAPFRIVDNDQRPFRVEVAKRLAALNTTIGWAMAALRHVSSVLGTNLPNQVRADWRNWSRGKQVDLDRQSDVLTRLHEIADQVAATEHSD